MEVNECKGYKIKDIEGKREESLSVAHSRTTHKFMYYKSDAIIVVLMRITIYSSSNRLARSLNMAI